MKRTEHLFVSAVEETAAEAAEVIEEDAAKPMPEDKPDQIDQWEPKPSIDDT